MSLPTFEYGLGDVLWVEIEVTSLTGGEAANLTGNPDYWTPAEPLDAEYEVYAVWADNEYSEDDFWDTYLANDFDILEYLSQKIYEDIEEWIKNIDPYDYI